MRIIPMKMYNHKYINTFSITLNFKIYLVSLTKNVMCTF